MRRLLRYIIAFILIPLALLGGLELALRLAHYGFPSTLFVTKMLDGRAMLVINQDIARRYLHNPRHRAEFRPLPACIPLQKPPGTYRVFVLGGSAAQGMCYEHFSFARMMDVMLQSAVTSMTFEIVNCGIEAIDSRVVREFVDECVAYQPDLLVLYCGNNELIGPFGPASVSTWLGASPAWLSDVRVWLSGLKLSQLAQATLAALTPGTPAQQWSNTWARLQHERRHVLGRDQVNPALIAYTNNMAHMARAARLNGAEILLCTPVINLRDFPPFGSASGEELTPAQAAEFSNTYHTGVALQHANQYQDAAAAFIDATGIDGLHADAHYRLAECLYETKAFGTACEHYLAAAMFDTYPARPGVLLSAALYELAVRDGIGFCLLDAALGSGLRFGLVNQERAFDHVHLTLYGHYLAASNTVALLIKRGVLPAPVRPLPAYDECLEKLGWSQWDKAHADFFVGKFLLRNALMPDYSAHRRVARQAEARYGDALSDQSWRSNTTLLADAAAHCLMALQQRPDDLFLHDRTAAAYAALGAGHIAYGRLREIQTRDPWYQDLDLRLARAAQMEGLAQYRRGNFPAALQWFTRSLSNYPTAAGYVNRAQTCTGMGSNQWALADYARALALEPDNALAHNSMGVLYLRMQQYGEAVEACTAAIDADPGYGPAYANRAVAQARLGRMAQARRDIKAAQARGVTVDAVTLEHMGTLE